MAILPARFQAFAFVLAVVAAACAGEATRAPVRDVVDRDPDRDGIVGQADLCPADAEDRDGIEDEDGCPDPDNDHDRVLDAADRCPNDAEVYNGTDDDDGCPDRGRVIVQECVDYVIDKIYFRASDASIHPPSGPILDAIAATLSAEPRMIVEVAGHRAPGERDATLGLRRARAVIDALVARGIDAARLHPADYGTSRPIDRARSSNAAERNRRVEFQVLDEAATAPGVPAWVPCGDGRLGQARRVPGTTCRAACASIGRDCVRRLGQAGLEPCVPSAAPPSGQCDDVFEAAWTSQCLCGAASRAP